MSLITFFFTQYETPVTLEPVCSCSTCKDAYGVNYHAVSFHLDESKMNISCFKISLKLSGTSPGFDMEGLSSLLRILAFVLSHPLYLFLLLQAKAAQASHPT